MSKGELKVLPEIACDGCNKKGCHGTISSYYLCKECYDLVKSKISGTITEINNKVWLRDPMFQGGSYDAHGC